MEGHVTITQLKKFTKGKKIIDTVIEEKEDCESMVLKFSDGTSLKLEAWVGNEMNGFFDVSIQE